ncbi:MAG: cation:proton antiporter [Chlamydiae bacterium]|nr:cation:proton antiporter [Chlamydiota bacterium]
MDGELIHLKIVIILTFGFTFASMLGYLSLKLKLSPIMGYLIAGYLVGPNSPGFVADKEIAEQLAEIGVILMMFGVGLHFKWQDLVRVKNIAIPGAIGQTVFATLITACLMKAVGWSWEEGILLGLALGVASTVVLVRVLTSNHLIHKEEGKIAVGWLIVEDIITVAAILLIPTLAASFNGQSYSTSQVVADFTMAIFKFFVLAVIMLTIGKRIVNHLLSKVQHLMSEELFLLTILASTFVIASASAVLFGTSIALGAFIAGMSTAQTPLRQYVLHTVTPLKDTFIVIFFLSAGMFFNPFTIFENFGMFLLVLSIILIIKPILAFLITTVLKYPPKTAVTVAIALAQIGEFSFIMADQALKFKLLPPAGYDILVASALVSLSINPSLFKLVNLGKKRSTA